MDRFGLSVALVTPFAGDLTIDVTLMAEIARNVLKRGADTVTLFGTTGEGASLNAREKLEVVDQLAALGVDPSQMVFGLCATSVAETLDQVSGATSRGIERFLLTPPFYFTDPDNDALFAWHRGVLEAAPTKARFVLYNIPQLTGVTLEPQWIEQLVAAFPERLIAVKDSSGSWDSALGYLENGAIPVLVGDERLLPKAVRLGATGAISGMANLHPERLRKIVDTGEDDFALFHEVDAVVSFPVIAAIKSTLAKKMSAPSLERVRPPLHALRADDASRLGKAVALARAKLKPETAFDD